MQIVLLVFNGSNRAAACTHVRGSVKIACFVELAWPRQVCDARLRVRHRHSRTVRLHIAILKVVALVFHRDSLLSLLQRFLCQPLNDFLIACRRSLRCPSANIDISKNVPWIISTVLTTSTVSLVIVCPFEHFQFAVIRNRKVIIRAPDLEVIGVHRSATSGGPTRDRRHLGFLADRRHCKHRDLLSFLRETALYALYFSHSDRLAPQQSLERFRLPIVVKHVDHLIAAVLSRSCAKPAISIRLFILGIVTLRHIIVDFGEVTHSRHWPTIFLTIHGRGSMATA